MKRIFTLLLLLPLFSFSQNGLTSYPMPPGYPFAQVQFKNVLAIDNAGNKWVGFRDIGLGKFDGANWTIYKTANSAIPSDNVTALAVDAANNIWVGTLKNGLAMFDGTNWAVYDKSNSAIPSDSIYSLAINGSDVWIGTKYGAAKFNGTTFTNYNTSNSGIVNNIVKCFSFENGNIWIGTQNGLSMFNGGNWINYTTFNSGLNSNNILCLYYDGSSIWLGTYGGSIHQFSSGKIIPVDSLNSIPFLYPGSNYSIAQGFYGGILFNWAGNDMGEFIPSTSQFKMYPKTSGGQLFLRDAGGILWFITKSGWDTIHSQLFSFDHLNYVPPVDCHIVTTDNLKLLDINQVSAAILNKGDLHWNPFYSNHGLYEVPKGSSKESVYASAIWFAGLDASDSIHGVGQEYRSWGCDLFPGPFNNSNPSVYDKIWKVSRYKVEEFKYEWTLGNVQNGTYKTDPDILSWPAINDTSYAPFVDINGNGIYDPLTGGDYPKIKGDECLYFIMNDNGLHAQTQCAQMGIEIHAFAYAYTCPQLPDSEQILNYTTLYHYDFINKSANVYHKTYFGYWQDTDLGCATDDYVGCNTTGNYSYYYNGDTIDNPCMGELGYGTHPPMLSTVVLNGALADQNDGIDNNNNGVIDEVGEKNLMTGFDYLTNGLVSDPTSCLEYYRLLTGHWVDGSSYLDCNGDSTHFSFPDFPYDTAGCSEVTFQNTPGDRRNVIGSGPFTFNPGQKIEYDFALVWTRDTTLPFMSKQFFDRNLHDNKKIQEWFAKDSFPSCLLLNVDVAEAHQNPDGIYIYPNPTSGVFNLTMSRLESVNIKIYNVYGECIHQQIRTSANQQIDLFSQPSGIYVVEVKGKDSSYFAKVVKQ